MASDRKLSKAPKTESLTIRLDPKMRFALDFVARINGQTITKVIERSVSEAADRLTVGDESSGIRRWVDYWDVSDGVRAINLAKDPNTHRTFEEEELLDFVQLHWNYFAMDPGLDTLKRLNIDILWPHMPKILEAWRLGRNMNIRICVDFMREIFMSSGFSIDKWMVEEKYANDVIDDGDIDFSS